MINVVDKTESVKSVRTEERVSQKTGNPYIVLVVEFNNSYAIEQFLNNEQKFILGNM